MVMTGKKRKGKMKKDYADIRQRLFCLQAAKKSIRFWPVTLLINLVPTWLIMQTGESGPIMTFFTWILCPPMLLVGEVFFLLLGTLAEIPAEMIADALFPRLPGKTTSVKKTDGTETSPPS